MTGRILDADGRPIRNALVEIGRSTVAASSAHGDSDKRDRDQNFQGFGRFSPAPPENTTSARSNGAVPGRTPHIHFKVKQGQRELLTTQCYVKGEARNDRDGIYRSLRDPAARAALTIDFAPVKESKIGELAATFDIVLGEMPQGESARAVCCRTVAAARVSRVR